MQTFHSKVSFILVIIVVCATLIPLAFFLLDETSSTKESFIFPISMMGLLVLMLYFMFETKYIISQDFLHIKIGFIPYGKVPIKSITKIEKTHTLLSSPAASLDRIIIYYGSYNSVIISPKDKVKFIKQLEGINPSITSTISNGN